MKQKVLICVVFVLMAGTGVSQNVINTPYGKVTLPTQTHPTFPHSTFYSGTSKRASSTFIIQMKDNSVDTAKATLKVKGDTTMLKRRSSKQPKRIQPKQTSMLTFIDGENAVIGFPAGDTCWLFNVELGELNGYAANPLDTKNIVAVQRGPGTRIYPLSKANLRPMVSDDPKATKLLERGKLVAAIRQYNKNKRR